MDPQKFDVLKIKHLLEKRCFEGKYVSFKNIKFPRGNYQPSKSIKSFRSRAIGLSESRDRISKTGEYPRLFPNFQNCVRCEKDLKGNKDNSLHLGRICSDICPWTLSVPRSSQFSSLLGTDNVLGQISEYILAPNGDYCLFIE